MAPTQYSGNQSFLKELNLASSMRVIRSRGLISRAELADTLGLNRSTITAIANRLLEEEWVREVGLGDSTGGRPPKLLQFNAEAAYAISIDWTPNSVKMYISDLKGNVVYAAHTPYDIRLAPSCQVDDVIAKLTAGLAGLPAKPHGVLGIGIGVPGIIDRGAVSSYDLAWDKVRLDDYFSAAFDCPIIVENIANAGLTAERYFGCAESENDVCYLRLEKGISAGFLHRGSIYRGHAGFAGYVGHSVIDVHGQRCVCGNRGCWQTYASENALMESYLRAAGLTETTMDALIALVKENDPAAVKAVDQFTEYLGIGIANIVNTLNPGLIVINSSLHEIGGAIYNPLMAVIENNALPYPRRNVRVTFSTLGENAIVYGAAALILDHVFSLPNVTTS